MLPDKLSNVTVDHHLINLIMIIKRTYHPNLKSNPDLSNINPSIINAAWSAEDLREHSRSEAFLKNRKNRKTNTRFEISRRTTLILFEKDHFLKNATTETTRNLPLCVFKN